jgi:phage baseplate assembly protein W
MGPFLFAIFTYKKFLVLYLSINIKMAKSRYININYPFKNSNEGFFLDLNSEQNPAIKADLMHLILTRKGQRLYNPDFGTDLLKYIFEPEDGLTFSSIQDEIKTVVKKYLPKLQINQILIDQSTESEHAAVVRIDYTITDDVFNETDFVIINI